MKNRRNYYRILHVQPDAPREVIRSSYRTIMHKMRTHPDLGGDAASAALVNEAYEILSNAEQRAAYDQMREDLAWWRNAANEPEQDAPEAASATTSANAPEPEVQPLDCCAFCGCLLRYEQPQVGLANFCPSCDSPLQPLLNFDALESDRRTIERIPKQLPISIWTRWPQAAPLAGVACDLSLSGLRFNTQVRLAPDHIVKIDCAAFKAVACVVRCEPQIADWQMGAHFLSLSFARSRGSFVQERV